MSKGDLVSRQQALAAAQPIIDLYPDCHIVGSLRRGLDEVHDVDILVFGDPRDAKTVAQAKRCGAKRGSFVIDGVQVDVMHIPDEQSLGGMLLHFTGSKNHNIVMRNVAKERGLKLNEYGLWDRETGARISADSEKELFAALDMEYVEPCDRTADFGDE